ncbi:MAG: integrase arm-type DNA-binding domain-containing protein [Cloacibacillus porcorum]|uniref:tyrosine-type recombinase/integrase n=1 Tax=Cloacibacillus porcorum TaxID=1197717 RepID=UPI0023EF853D|nr:integrase arm-type DNA-binding domain-containing protein [Cloacibacillus porcorum]MCD7876219.1 integrase arm-type DNA-binding domain-containing protein [Cloacibacillus porcorum]
MLTELQARNAKAESKVYRLKDEAGLSLEVRPSGKNVWRMRYWIAGRERILTFGDYPLFSLKEARDRRDIARRIIADGGDPAEKWAEERAAVKAAEEAAKDTFEAVALEWLDMRLSENLSDRYKHKTEWRLRKYILPSIGKIRFSEVSPLDLLGMCKSLEARGLVETEHRLVGICSQIFRYGIIWQKRTDDPTYSLRGALMSPTVRHFSSIQDKSLLGEFYVAIESCTGSEIIKAALRFLVLNFPRPGELRHAEWSEFNFDTNIWSISAEKMKMKRPHMVPLGSHSLALLKALHPLTGHGRYVFPSPRSGTGSVPMSDMALNVAMRAMGYEQEDVSAHGFRHTASTMLNDSLLWSPDAIERQLAHVDGNKVRETYNAAEYWEERKRMKQWWEDFVIGEAEAARKRAEKKRAEAKKGDSM